MARKRSSVTLIAMMMISARLLGVQLPQHPRERIRRTGSAEKQLSQGVPL
ncbi:hypothetical protein ACHHV8_06965 [Paenibacillus sp. TAB 01]